MYLLRAYIVFGRLGRGLKRNTTFTVDEIVRLARALEPEIQRCLFRLNGM